MCWRKYPLFVYTCRTAAAKHQGWGWDDCSNTYKTARLTLTCTRTLHSTSGMTKLKWSSLITFLLTRLFELVSGTTARLPPHCSLVHLPVLLGKCRVSAVMQRATNGLRWERLGSVVGTLLPSFLSLPGNRCRLREGPPAACGLNEGQTKNACHQVSYTSQCWFFFCHLPPPFFFFFFY